MIGNFEKAIPQSIELLEKEMAKKRREIWAIEAGYNHDCDCEYCTIEPEDIPETTQEEIDVLEAEVNELKLGINRLKRHAKVHGVKL